MSCSSKRCTRKSSKIINGASYCAQHAKMVAFQIQIADSVWKQKQLESQKQKYDQEQIMLYKRFGYKKMGLFYTALGGTLETNSTKQSIFTWLLVGNRLKSELGKDMIKHITYFYLLEIVGGLLSDV